MWTAAVVWAAVGCLGGIGLAQQAESPGSAKVKATPAVLLEKGIYTEETVGDLDAAIKVYQQIVDDAKANRQYAARAQYRLAKCYLKKGDKAKAERALRELLATYPQEKLIAAKARGQLAKLTPRAGAAPRLMRTTPEAMTNDVDPSLDKITVTFDRPMIDKSWSFTGGGETFPKRTGEISYDADRTTCTMPVKLQPGKVYWVGVNSPSYRSFRAADGTPAQRYVILFATKSADGKPTPLPDDLARRAAAINEASRRAAGISETPAQAGVPRLPQEVMGYIISMHHEAARTAQEKRLRVNTHIYGVNERFALYSGGLLGYVNSSDKPQAGPIHLGNFGREKPNHTLMDEAGTPQQFELRERSDATFGKYGLWWKPDQPVQPGASRLLGYISKDVKMLPLIGGSARLTMENTFGSQVLENFFLVLPRGMTIIELSGPPTSKTTLGQFDIYLWQKQVPFNTRHLVTMGLRTQRVASDAEIAEIVENAVTGISTMADGDHRIGPLLQSLAGLREPAVVKAVAKYFDSDKDNIRRAAIYIVWKDVFSDPSPALAGLVKLCSHKEDMTRGMAALALGTTKASSSFDALADMTANDKSPFARRCGAYALGLLGDQKAKPILEKAAKDPEKFVRNNAEAALTMLAKAAKAEALKGKLINWVEKYFSENYRDITARKTIEWGDPESTVGGNLAIRYKYLATIWNKSKKIIEQRFTFTPEGKYVSAETVERTQVASETVAPSVQDRKEAENLTVEGWRLWNARKLPEAEAKFKAAVAKDPTSANAFNGLGWAQQNQGKIINAKDSFEKAVAIDPKQPAALNGLGWIAKSQGKPDQAIEYWQKAVAANPGTTAALNGLATTFADLGQYDKATEACQLWLKAEPKSADAKAALKKAQDAAGASKEGASAAEQWVKLVDDGKYGESWDAASAFLRKAVTKDTFAKQIEAARKPLGKVKSRKIMSAKFETAMPGASDGQYVVVQFEAVFENKKQAVETITPMKCKDGKWRVSGYYIK